MRPCDPWARKGPEGLRESPARAATELTRLFSPATVPRTHVVGVQGTVHSFSRSLPTLGVPQASQSAIETALFATGAGAVADDGSSLIFGPVNDGQALPGYVQQPGEARWA